eukprot:4449318-Prymnesium_polylepis.1
MARRRAQGRARAYSPEVSAAAPVLSTGKRVAPPHTPPPPCRQRPNPPRRPRERRPLAPRRHVRRGGRRGRRSGAAWRGPPAIIGRRGARDGLRARRAAESLTFGPSAHSLLTLHLQLPPLSPRCLPPPLFLCTSHSLPCSLAHSAPAAALSLSLTPLLTLHLQLPVGEHAAQRAQEGMQQRREVGEPNALEE